MKRWEKDLRDQLDKDLTDGYYQISNCKLVLGTGKGGAINYYVAFEKERRKLMGLEPLLQDMEKYPEDYNTISKKEYTSLTEQDIRDFMNSLLKYE